MVHNESVAEETAKRHKRFGSLSILWKILTIFCLTLGLLIPVNMIANIISEREATQASVKAEIAQSWAGEQTLFGPILVIPYQQDVESTNKKTTTHNYQAYILPKKYDIKSNLATDARYRGIYQSIVYTNAMELNGYFDLNTLSELKIPPQKIQWKQAFLVMGISDSKGLASQPTIQWQGKPLELYPGVHSVSITNSGLYTPVNIDGKQRTLAFKSLFNLKGREHFSFVPIGEQNHVEIASNWTSPSFSGAVLPTKHKITGKGFTASWDVPYFARNYGQALNNVEALSSRDIYNSRINVQLLTPVDSYRQSERAVKYAILFLVLTFATYFLFEIIGRYRLHFLQYLLVGCAISLFYLLLIAISEVVAFHLAYILASIATISAISLYSKAILGKLKKSAGWIIAALLTILYSYLYVLLQLEDYSLLFGAIGLFIVLAVMMFVTRNIDWYQEQTA